MIRQVIAVALTTAFVATTAAPMASAEDKEMTPQQQKMKGCAAGWKEEKAKTGTKGRDAYRKFMGDCLKKQS